MDTMTINIPVNVPRSYKVDFLKEQLAKYAAYLVAYTSVQEVDEKKYKNKALCGIIAPEKHDGEYLEEYLTEKYGI